MSEINMFNDGLGGIFIGGCYYPEDEARALWEDGEETEDEYIQPEPDYSYQFDSSDPWLPVRGNVKSEDVPHLLDNSNRFGLNAHYWLNPEGDSYNFEVRSPGFPADLDY